MTTIKEALEQIKNLSEAVSDSSEELEAKVRKIFADNETESRINIFEVSEPNDQFIEHFDDGDVDFSQFTEHEQKDDFNNPNGSKYYSFMISGGKNGSGEWKEYLDDLEEVFKKLQEETGLEPVLYKLHNDILDDLWTGYVFMYETAPEEMKENYKKLYEGLTKENYDIYEDGGEEVAKFIEDSNLTVKDILEMTEQERVQLEKDLADEFDMTDREASKAVDFYVENHTETESADEPIEEKVEKHDTLNPKLFDGTQLKPEIKEAAKKIADKYMETLKEYEVPFNLKDIVLVGSNTSYNYNDKSDLDLHLLADMSGIKDPKSQATIYGAYASLFNKNYSITFYDIPVEIYVETEDNPIKINGIYSVLQDRWIREPVQQEIPDLDEEAFNKMLDEWKSKCEQVLGIASSTEENEEDLIEN